MSGIFDHTFVKPIVAEAVAGLADRFIMKNQNTPSNAMFAGALSDGIFVSGMVGETLAPFFPTSTPIGAFSKALEGRIIEITLGAGSAYAINRFVLRNEISQQDMIYKLAIVVGADVVGEMVGEFVELSARG